ncbi:MAG: class I SAM-dependent methyltransferase [Alphaproteobacteria bacterium]|nr:class I SAM-dependent methyltransferase [Alphaproteobacteria bacterium]
MADLTQSALRSKLPASAVSRPSSARLARLLFNRWTHCLENGTLDVTWPDGTSWRHTGDQPGRNAQIHIINPRIVRRAAFNGALGLADAYVDGDWDSPDIAAVLRLGIENETAFTPTAAQRIPAMVLGRLRHKLNANTRAGSRRNIAAHYDLGNAFYGAWLDESMTYSAGLFTDSAVSLTAAQEAKYARIADVAGLRHGDHVLEIGCGWGGFAIYAARRFGCRVIAVTLSRAQAEWVRRAVAAAGLSKCVEIRLQDYRDIADTFDRIVSIESFEAVGESYWPGYFDTLRNRLRPDGKAALQVITIADERFAAYRRNPDFIQLRVFPGGMLPSPQAFAVASGAAGLTIADTFSFGPSYAETLRQWRSRFEAAWPDLEALGFDERFRRLWRYYLCYCEAGFDTGTVSVAHYGLKVR